MCKSLKKILLDFKYRQRGGKQEYIKGESRGVISVTFVY